MSATTDLQCSHPGCHRIRRDHPLCPHHLMLWRRGTGLCANCGGARERVPVINDLTGRQLRRGSGRLPVWQMRCCACGRLQRAEVIAT